MLSYWFYPNPGNADYANPKVLLLFAACLFLFLGSFIVSSWRKNHGNSVTRKLARSWSSAMRWLAVTGVILIVSRVEDIQFMAMRFLWVLWMLGALLFVLLQMWLWRKKHYTILPSARADDPREKYLPGKK